MSGRYTTASHGANVSPRLEEAAYRTEIIRCVRELGVVAIKMDPNVHA